MAKTKDRETKYQMSPSWVVAIEHQKKITSNTAHHFHPPGGLILPPPICFFNRMAAVLANLHFLSHLSNSDWSFCSWNFVFGILYLTKNDFSKTRTVENPFQKRQKHQGKKLKIIKKKKSKTNLRLLINKFLSGHTVAALGPWLALQAFVLLASIVFLFVDLVFCKFDNVLKSFLMTISVGICLDLKNFTYNK